MAGDYDLVVVANRLPVDRVEEADGSTSWRRSPGGLVTALEPVMQQADGAWVGWAGAAGEPPEPFDAVVYLNVLEHVEDDAGELRLAASALRPGGALLVFGPPLLVVIAIAFGTINVVGGFLVTDRMLGMFKSKPEPPKELPEE